MISIEVEGKDLVMDMSRDSGASTVIRKVDGQIRVEVANGQRACAWSFNPVVRSKTNALRDIRSDMETALRRVGLSAPAPVSNTAPDFSEHVRRTPKGMNGPIGDKIREAIVRRIGKPVEAEQPDADFPHVVIPEKKVPKEVATLRRRVTELEREMASVKQVTDQLR